jgi:hypothetical protein
MLTHEFCVALAVWMQRVAAATLIPTATPALTAPLLVRVLILPFPVPCKNMQGMQEHGVLLCLLGAFVLDAFVSEVQHRCACLACAQDHSLVVCLS